MARARPAVIGGFVLGSLAIVVAAILFFGNGDLFSPKSKAVVFFEGSVGGLAPGAPVTFRGVRVGAVARVALVVDPTALTARIPVYLRLEPDQVVLASGATRTPMLTRLITAGLRAKLVSQSLVTGQMLVELELNPDTPAHLIGGGDPGVPEIPAITSDLDELRQQLTHAPLAATVSQALATLTTIDKVAARIGSEIGPLAAGVRQTLDGATHTLEIASAAIQDVREHASSTLDQTHALALEARQQLAGRGTELSRVLADADHTLQTINTLVTSANGLVAPRSQARGDLEAMLRDPSVVLRGRASR